MRRVHFEWSDEMAPGAFPVCGTQAMSDRPVLSRDLAEVTCRTCLRIMRQVSEPSAAEGPAAADVAQLAVDLT
jgi:hypothetical protein